MKVFQFIIHVTEKGKHYWFQAVKAIDFTLHMILAVLTIPFVIAIIFGPLSMHWFSWVFLFGSLFIVRSIVLQIVIRAIQGKLKVGRINIFDMYLIEPYEDSKKR